MYYIHIYYIDIFLLGSGKGKECHYQDTVVDMPLMKKTDK